MWYESNDFPSFNLFLAKVVGRNVTGQISLLARGVFIHLRQVLWGLSSMFTASVLLPHFSALNILHLYHPGNSGVCEGLFGFPYQKCNTPGGGILGWEVDTPNLFKAAIFPNDFRFGPPKLSFGTMWTSKTYSYVPKTLLRRYDWMSTLPKTNSKST